MSDPLRQAKVFAALLISMSLGAAVLLALGQNPQSAGSFCLDDYYQLESVAKTVASQTLQSPDRWNCIEVSFGPETPEDSRQQVLPWPLQGPLEPEYHFAVYSGPTGPDGAICPTRKWNTQQSAAIDGDSPANEKTIRICIIADGSSGQPTNLQAKRLESLIAELTRRFDIPIEAVNFPTLWQ